MAQWVKKPTSIWRDAVPSLASVSGLRIWCCHELWYRSQTLLRSCVAVAVVSASSCSSDSIPSLGTSIYHRCSAEKKQNKNKNLNLKKKSTLAPFFFLVIFHFKIISPTGSTERSQIASATLGFRQQMQLGFPGVSLL